MLEDKTLCSGPRKFKCVKVFPFCKLGLPRIDCCAFYTVGFKFAHIRQHMVPIGYLETGYSWSFLKLA